MPEVPTACPSSWWWSSFVLVSLVASVLFWFFFPNPTSTNLVLSAAPWLVLPLALVGFLDDRHSLPSSFRYCFQLATACVVILVSSLVFPSVAFLPFFIFLLIAVTAVINFTNFMDGLDGLVAGCMLVAIISAAIKISAPLSIWALVGSLFGFLIWNWSPAKVFMGDVGSTFGCSLCRACPPGILLVRSSCFVARGYPCVRRRFPMCAAEAV